MKLHIAPELLAAELAAITGILDKKTTVAAHEFVLLETTGKHVRLVVSNGLMQTEAFIPVNHVDYKDKIRCYGDVKMCLPAKKLEALVKLLNGGVVEISVDEKGHGHLKHNKSEFKLSSIVPDMFPQMSGEFGETVGLPAQEMRSMIHLARGFIGEDDSRFAFSGGLLSLSRGAVSLTGTDGQRLSYSVVEHDLVARNTNILIPHKALVQLREMIGKGGDLKMAIARNTRGEVSKVKFKIGHRFLTTNLTAGAFPNVDAALSMRVHAKADVTLDKHEFLDALKRTLVVNEAGNRIVQIFLDGDGEELALSTDGIDAGSDRVRVVDLDTDDAYDSFTLGMNGDHLSAFLNVVKEASTSDNVVLRYAGPTNFVELRPAEAGMVDFRYLVAPVRPLNN